MIIKEEKTDIIVSYKDLIAYEESPIINSSNKNISIKLLNDLLESDRLFKSVIYFFESDTEKIYIKGQSKNFKSNINIVSFDKLELFEALKKLISNYDKKLSMKFKRRYKKIASLITFSSFWEKYKEEIYTKRINSKIYVIKVQDIIDLLVISKEDYQTIIKSKNYNDIPIDRFAYLLCSFFREYSILRKYIFPERINNRLSNILSYKDIDFEHLEVLNYTCKNQLAGIEINKELENKILEGMPETFNDTEKAIYVYIKLCRTLSYSDEYFAAEQKGMLASKHRNLNNITKISLENNEVVCYEFNLIYAKLLSKLNINFEFSGESDVLNYGSGHAYLKFKAGKNIVIADSTISIITSDMVNAKLNYPLIGLKSINNNVNTQNRFKLSVKKVYEYIIKKESNNEITNIKEYSFEETLNEYEGLTKYEEIDLYTKFKIMIEKVLNCDLKKLELLSYLIILKSIIFTETEKDKNIKITLVRQNTLDPNNPIRSVAVITLNYDNIKNTDSNIYYIYDPTCGIYNVSESELIGLLKQKELKEIYGNPVLLKKGKNAK